MLNTRLVTAIAFGLMAGPGLAQVPVSAQVKPPYVTIPTSAVASGDVVTVSGGNFPPGSVVILKLTGPVSDSWSQSVGIGSGGHLSYPIRFSEQGMYRVEVLGRDGKRLTMLMVSAARHR